RPDAFHLEPFFWQLDEAISTEEPLPSCALRRFRSPISASVFLTEDKPAHLRSAELHGEIQDGKGPYHSSGHWWDERAWARAEWEMPALALLDRNGVYGAQRFSVAAREQNVRPIVGCELSLEDGRILPVLVENRTGYKNLCELLTQAHLRSEKGECAVQWSELPQFTEGWVALFGLGSAGASSAVSRTSRDTHGKLFGGGAESPSRTGGSGRGARAPYNAVDRTRFLIE